MKKQKNDLLELKYLFSPANYICLGILHHIKGKLNDAKEYYEEALRRCAIAEDYIKPVALHNLGIVYTDFKDLEKAKECFENAKKTFEKYWFTYGKARVLHHLGLIEELKGNFEKAREYYNKSLELKEDLTRENREKIRKTIENDPEFKELVEKVKELNIDVISDFERKKH